MTFDTAFAFVIGAEGGYVDDPRDPGGKTKYGISQRAYPLLNIAALTLEDAKAIYLRDYWEPAGCDQLPAGIATALFDSAVNQGIKPAIKFLQRALRVDDDGIIGPATIAAAEKAGPDSLITNFCVERALHYASLSTFDVYGRGWMRRLFHVARVTVPGAAPNA
jgi:lysozyme family protein